VSTTEQPSVETTKEAKARAKADKAYAKATRPWYKKKRFMIPLAFVVLMGIAAGASGGDGTSGSADSGATQSDTPAKSDANEAVVDEGSEPAEQNEPEMTSGQENALRAAENYLDMMPFSKAGLIRQLSSPAGDDYSKADATFAANNVDADWNAEAVEAAENYIDMMPMSKSGLIEQLSSPAGDRFTPAQARYAANKVL
jgi:predicted 3-demethylubiquinone-9 3-methyltransferase (glyoxalase superfamily)